MSSNESTQKFLRKIGCRRIGRGLTPFECLKWSWRLILPALLPLSGATGKCTVGAGRRSRKVGARIRDHNDSLQGDDFWLDDLRLSTQITFLEACEWGSRCILWCGWLRIWVSSRFLSTTWTPCSVGAYLWKSFFLLLNCDFVWQSSCVPWIRNQLVANLSCSNR